MSLYSCKVVAKSYVGFSFLKWDAEFHLNGETNDVPAVYIPKYYASAEDFLADQARKFGSWLLEGLNGLLHEDGEVIVYDPSGNILWEKKAFRHATPPQFPSSP